MTSRVVRGLLLAGLVLGGALPAAAQTSWLSGYLLTVLLFSASTEISPSNVADFSRLRLSMEPSLGPLSFEVAYEHAATAQQRNSRAGFGLGAVPSGGEWFDLDWTITEEDHVRWRHRFDRLAVAWGPGGGGVVGRGGPAGGRGGGV